MARTRSLRFNARERKQSKHASPKCLGHVRPLSKTTIELSIQAKEKVHAFLLFDFPSPGSCKKKIAGNLKDGQRFYFRGFTILTATLEEIWATSFIITALPSTWPNYFLHECSLYLSMPMFDKFREMRHINKRWIDQNETVYNYFEVDCQSTDKCRDVWRISRQAAARKHKIAR